MRAYRRMIRQIRALRAQGFQYKEIDEMLNLPYRAYRIMRTKGARAVK